MSFPNLRDEHSRNITKKSRQAVSTNEDAGIRIKSSLGARDVSWLSRETGFGDTTIRDAIKRGPARADVAVAIAKALRVSTDWLLTGRTAEQSFAVAAVEDADWVEVPEISLAGIDDARKGEEVSRTTFRRDWLHQSYGRSNGLWTTRLPSDYPPLDLAEGDLVICCDAVREELQERHLCIWRASILGRLLVARFTFVHRGNSLVTIEDGDYWVNPYLLPNDVVDGGGGDLLPVARILGRPFVRIR